MYRRMLPLLVVAALLATACVSRAGTPTASPSPTPTPSSTSGVSRELPSPTTAGNPTPISEEQLREELRRARFSTTEWRKTDFRIHSVPLREFTGGGPGKDDIPPIDQPKFETVAQADQWLNDREPVQVVAIKGDARAYPQQILIWHEIVNDHVGGEPVTITY